MKLVKNASLTKLWGDEQCKAFQEIKKAIAGIKTLGYYNPADKTQVIADASPVALGCVLVQFDKTGASRIIAFGNKSLSDCEKRYCQTEKEALALVWAVEHFYIYLYGKNQFELVTDHKPLETIFGPKSKTCARIERWVLRLQSYNFKVIYRSGKSNIADPLSRLCPVMESATSFDMDCINQIIDYSRPIAVKLQDLKKFSRADEEFAKLREGLLFNRWDKTVETYKIFQNELTFHEDIVLRGNRIVIPLKIRKQVLDAAHEGHPGIVAMKSRLRTKVWWPKIDRDAERVVRSCKGCTLVAAPNPPIPMKRRELPSNPWIAVAIDLLGPLPHGDYIFVIVDYYSRYKEVKIVRDITSRNMINILQEIFSRLGYPPTMTSDTGKQFGSFEFENFCLERGITLYNTIPYWPQQNGEVERQNRDLLKRIRISCTLKSDWKKDLLDYLIMYNSTPHATTGKTPSELFFGRLFRDKLPSIIDLEYKDENTTDGEVRDRDTIQKEKGKEYSDRKRNARPSDLELGDKVYIKNLVKENKTCTNFDPKPHTVVNKNGGDITVRDDVTGKEYRRNVLHLKRTEGEWKVCREEERDPDTE